MGAHFSAVERRKVYSVLAKTQAISTIFPRNCGTGKGKLELAVPNLELGRGKHEFAVAGADFTATRLGLPGKKLSVAGMRLSLFGV
jgi:hypothetical protein